jgi:hypothetical protein
LEKDIKDQLKSSAVMLQEVPSGFFWEKERTFANTGCFLKRNKGEMSLLCLEASRGDGIK